jgi:hypothetical protein
LCGDDGAGGVVALLTNGGEERRCEDVCRRDVLVEKFVRFVESDDEAWFDLVGCDGLFVALEDDGEADVKENAGGVCVSERIGEVDDGKCAARSTVMQLPWKPKPCFLRSLSRFLEFRFL